MDGKGRPLCQCTGVSGRVCQKCKRKDGKDGCTRVVRGFTQKGVRRYYSDSLCQNCAASGSAATTKGRQRCLFEGCDTGAASGGKPNLCIAHGGGDCTHCRR